MIEQIILFVDLFIDMMLECVDNNINFDSDAEI